MTIIAAFDTSSLTGSIALLKDGKAFVEVDCESVGTHSVWLLDRFSRMLKDAEIKCADIDIFAIAAGPGAFTGLRVGISAIKGMAWALGKKTLPVSTLKAMAMNLSGSGKLVCPLLDARRGEIYAAAYEFSDGVIKEVVAGSSWRPELFYDELKKVAPDKQIVFLGPGLGVYEKEIAGQFRQAELAPIKDWSIKASNVGVLASASLDTAIDAQMLKPLYLKKFEPIMKKQQ